MDFLKTQLNELTGLKYIPSQSDLEEAKRLDILGGIHKNGGFAKVSQILNIPSKKEFLILNPKPRKTKWTKEFLLTELKPYLKQYNRIPSEKEFIKLGRGDIVVGIKRNGGFVKIKEDLGFVSSRKKWDEETVLLEIQKIIETEGKFPDSSTLKTLGRSDLLSGINSLGGLNFFRSKIGLTPIKRKKQYSFEDVVKEVKIIADEIGYFPSSNDLAKLDKVYLNSRIQCVGGFQKIRKYLGFELRKK